MVGWGEEVKRHPGRHRAWAVQGSRARVCASEHAQQKRPSLCAWEGVPDSLGLFHRRPEAEDVESEGEL